jgi:hypothetical protein
MVRFDWSKGKDRKIFQIGTWVPNFLWEDSSGRMFCFDVRIKHVDGKLIVFAWKSL